MSLPTGSAAGPSSSGREQEESLFIPEVDEAETTRKEQDLRVPRPVPTSLTTNALAAGPFETQEAAEAAFAADPFLVPRYGTLAAADAEHARRATQIASDLAAHQQQAEANTPQVAYLNQRRKIWRQRREVLVKEIDQKQAELAKLDEAMAAWEEKYRPAEERLAQATQAMEGYGRFLGLRGDQKGHSGGEGTA